MKRQFVNTVIALFVLSVSISACKKGGDTPIANDRAVKIEVTGNYTGYITLNYTNQNGTMIKDTITSLPWSKSIAYFNKVDVVKASGTSDVAGHLGSSGQSASIKIYSANTEKASQSATADGTGSITVPAAVLDFNAKN